jgi:DNA-binding response OmpR family regulator
MIRSLKSLRCLPLPDVLPGPRFIMSSPAAAPFTGRYILVADEDPKVVDFIIHTLRQDGHAVFHAYDAQSAVQLVYAMHKCDLVISNTKVDGVAGVDLIRQLRHDRPTQAIAYLANSGRSTPEIEARLPPDVPIIREPFTAEELRARVATLLDGGAR